MRTPSSPQRFERGAAAAVVSRMPEGVADPANLVLVGRHPGGAGRARPGRAAADHGADRRHHRQRRQDRHQGGAAPRPGPPGADPRQCRQPQQSLGRALEPRPAARGGELRRARAGHEPCGRDPRPHVAGPAARRGDHHGRTRPISSSSPRWRRSPTPRARSSRAWSRAASPSSTATTSTLPGCAPTPSGRGPGGSSPSAAIPPPTGGWTSCASHPSRARWWPSAAVAATPIASASRASIWSSTAWPCSRSPKRWVPTSRRAAGTLGDLRASAGRGERRRIAVARRRGAAAGRELQRQPRLDARGPGRARSVARPAHRRARRHAGAGGDRRRPACGSGRRRRRRPGSSSSSPAARRWRGCTTHCRRHGAAPMPRDAAALAPAVLEAVRPGDVVLVKGSLGSRMARVVAALTGSGAPVLARAAS